MFFCKRQKCKRARLSMSAPHLPKQDLRSWQAWGYGRWGKELGPVKTTTCSPNTVVHNQVLALYYYLTCINLFNPWINPVNLINPIKRKKALIEKLELAQSKQNSNSTNGTQWKVTILATPIPCPPPQRGSTVSVVLWAFQYNLFMTGIHVHEYPFLKTLSSCILY